MSVWHWQLSRDIRKVQRDIQGNVREKLRDSNPGHGLGMLGSGRIIMDVHVVEMLVFFGCRQRMVQMRIVVRVVVMNRLVHHMRVLNLLHFVRHVNHHLFRAAAIQSHVNIRRFLESHR